jgi:adenosylcobinamide kinase/adenosylcobinamide-phosphate guanylyltransferase
VVFLATGRASDPEMAARVAAHRGERPGAWRVVEEPVDVGRVAGSSTILLDSVDGWLANRMEREGGADADWSRERLRALEAACASALEELAARGHLIAVSSEVGLSLVPLHPYGRAFADALGRLNQRLAAAAEEAFLVVAGIAVSLRGGGAAR